MKYTSYLICKHPPDRINVFREGLPAVFFVGDRVEIDKNVSREQLLEIAIELDAASRLVLNASTKMPIE